MTILLYDGCFAEKQGSKIKCRLCLHNCLIGENQFGLCSVRTNKGGSLKTINYGEITSMALDPIEKKPLYHFMPGENILSVGSFGCNFSCRFCQNYSIAHYKAPSQYMSPDALIEECLRLEDNVGIAFTYNEPSIWFEFVYETSKKLKSQAPHFKVVLITNGYIESEPLVELLPYVDAMNIDLKSFRQDYYKKVCGGDLKAVLDTIERSHKRCHIEITTLLVNGLNDSAEELEDIASYLGGLDKNIPLHLSRYFPTYKMNRSPTDVNVMLEGRKIAKKYLNYVFLGNLSNVDNSTYCPRCSKLLIYRTGFFTKIYIKQPICPQCGYSIRLVL